MNKFLENLKQAQNNLQTVDYFIYRILPLIKDKRLLIKIFIELKITVSKCINALLQYEYFLKRISLYRNSDKNMEVFEKKVAKKYNISSEEIKLIKELFLIVKKHENSSMEFIKGTDVIILGVNMEKEILTEYKAKIFLQFAKSILKKTFKGILKN